MIYSRKYSRLFMTLKQDREDFCYDSRGAMGRCIFEIRNNIGKIMIFAQGLKPRILYRVMLIKAEEGSTLGINGGLINIDDKGKGNYSVSFDPNDVFSSGLKIEDISAVLILVDGIGEAASVLTGFRDNSFDWQKGFKIANINEDKEEIKEEKKEENSSNESSLSEEKKNIDKLDSVDFKNDKAKQINKEENKAVNNVAEKNNSEDKKDIKEEVSNEDLKQENNLKNNADKDTENEKIKPQNAEKAVSDKNNISNKSTSSSQNAAKCGSVNSFNTFLERFKADILELEHYAFMTEAEKPPKRRGRGIQGLESIKRHNMKIKPFESCEEEFVWFKIMPCELTMVDSRLWRYMNNPFVCCGFRKYGHLILGVAEEEEKERYVIGVPDKYNSELCGDMDRLGFGRFKVRDNKEMEEGDFGYWLLEGVRVKEVE